MSTRFSMVRNPVSTLIFTGIVFLLVTQATAEEIKLVPLGSPPGAAFGSAVAFQDGLSVIGAPQEIDASGRQAGAVYLRTTDGLLSWRLIPSDADTRYQFGRAVDLDRGVIVVGAWYAAYVFRFDGMDWVEEAKLEGHCSDGRFGTAVAVSGDRLLVGSPLRGCLDASVEGYVFFYEHNGTGVWELARRLTAHSGTVGSYYGWSVSMEDDTAVVGAPGWGEVFTYRHDGSNWQVGERIADPIWGSGRSFGRSVSLHEGRLVVGTPGDSERRDGAGATYVYRQADTGGWTPEVKLLPPPTSPAQKLTGAYYGTTVALSGDLLVMGGPQADAAGQEDGAVSVFELKNGLWTHRATLSATGAGLYDHLGTGLDIDDGTILAGAPGHDGAGTDVGAAYLFTLDPTSDPNNQLPVARFSAIKDRLNVQLDASLSSDSDGTIVSYEWDFGDGNTGSGVITSHTFAASGTYTIRLTVTDNDGAKASVHMTTTFSDVNLLPVAKFTTATEYLKVSVDASGSYDLDGGIAGYHWDFGDGNAGSGRITSHTYSTAGTYTVTLTVTDREGATGNAANPVTVTAPPEIALTARGYKVRALQKVDLSWSGATTEYVNIYFSSLQQSEFYGVLIATVPNSGAYTHHIDRMKGTTYTYWVCEVGTDRCSNKVKVVFQ